MDTPIEIMIKIIEENPNTWQSLWAQTKKECFKMERENLIMFHIAGQKLKNESDIEDMGEMRNSAIREYDEKFRT